MEYREVVRIADELLNALVAEHSAKLLIIEAQEKADEVKLCLLMEATIDGKNPKARELQRSAVFAGSDAYQAARGQIAIRHAQAEMATMACKHAEALIKLTTSWLNSQQGGTVVNKTVDFDSELALDWVQEHYEIEQVFPVGVLIRWALNNGFVHVDGPETGPERDC